MAKTPLSARGKIVAGKVSLDAPDLYKAALNRWEGRIILTIEPEPTTRSGKANRFYWKMLNEWAKMTETGYTADELHEACRLRWNSKRIEIDGKEYIIGLTTTELSVREFSDYIEHVMADAANIDGFFLEPTPAEDWRV